MTAIVQSKEEMLALKAHCERVAKSGLVPDHFAKNPQAIAVAMDMARALGEEPVFLMRSIYFVSGRAGFSAEFMLSRLRKLGAIRGTVHYESSGSGPTLAMRAWAIDAESGERVDGPAVSMEMAKAEGWTRNAKYQSMPEVMLRKRAITFLVRDHYPDVIGGFHTRDELEDIQVSVRGPRQIAASASDDVLDILNAEPAEEPAEGEVTP